MEEIKMAQAHIYLCCGGGLSSGFLAQKVSWAAAKKGKIDATIEAKSESEVTQYLPKMEISALDRIMNLGWMLLKIWQPHIIFL